MHRVVGVILLSTVVFAFEAPALRNKFSSSPTCVIGQECFVSLPRTIKEVQDAGWVSPDETKDNELFDTYCKKNNNRACVLLDKKGSIAGHQISIPTAVEKLNISGINYETKGFKRQTLFGEEVFSNQIFFVPQEVIKSGGRDFDGQTGTGLWLQTKTELFNVPLKASELEDTPLKKQNCLPRMGNHWFWNNTRQLDQESYLPWFTLHNNDGDLHGFGFIGFGSSIDELFSSWFESVPNSAIEFIAPSTPDWIYDYSTAYGLYATHIYFGDEPWNIPC